MTAPKSPQPYDFSDVWLLIYSPQLLTWKINKGWCFTWECIKVGVRQIFWVIIIKEIWINWLAWRTRTSGWGPCWTPCIQSGLTGTRIEPSTSSSSSSTSSSWGGHLYNAVGVLFSPNSLLCLPPIMYTPVSQLSWLNHLSLHPPSPLSKLKSHRNSLNFYQNHVMVSLTLIIITTDVARLYTANILFLPAIDVIQQWMAAESGLLCVTYYKVTYIAFCVSCVKDWCNTDLCLISSTLWSQVI